jgi:hypothetical protein
LPKVIITAQVNDATKWEAAFRTHAELFKTYSIKTPIHFTTNGSEVTICMEPEDLDAFHRAMDSKATADAMAVDGVKRETVKMSVLDKGLEV